MTKLHDPSAYVSASIELHFLCCNSLSKSRNQTHVTMCMHNDEQLTVYWFLSTDASIREKVPILNKCKGTQMWNKSRLTHVFILLTESDSVSRWPNYSLHLTCAYHLCFNSISSQIWPISSLLSNSIIIFLYYFTSIC